MARMKSGVLREDEISAFLKRQSETLFLFQSPLCPRIRLPWSARRGRDDTIRFRESLSVGNRRFRRVCNQLWRLSECVAGTVAQLHGSIFGVDQFHGYDHVSIDPNRSVLTVDGQLYQRGHTWFLPMRVGLQLSFHRLPEQARGTWQLL